LYPSPSRDRLTGSRRDGHEFEKVRASRTLLSAATHGRFTQSGVSESILTGRTEFGVQMRAIHSSAATSAAAMHVTLGVTAQTTMYAAIAMRTYRCALARYTAMSETVVLSRLQGPTGEWSAIAQQVSEQPQHNE
jgi:hypothetical protein